MIDKDQLPFKGSLVILPTYNEADNVVSMVRAINQISAEFNVLVVDDNSPDGTSKLVTEEQKHNKQLYLINRKEKQGLGSAYIQGFKWALKNDYQYIYEMDCDFSHDPKDLVVLLRTMVNGQDMVIGSRYIDGVRIINWPIRRLLLSYLAALYSRVLTGMPIKDPTSGYNCMSRKILESIDLDNIMSNGYAFQIELKFRAWSKGFKLEEVPIIFYERRKGRSKMHPGIVREAILMVIKLRIKKILKTL